MTEIGLFSTNRSNTAPSIGGLLDDKIEEGPSYTISSHLYTTGLGERFTEVWDSPHCPMALRKTIIRTVVKEVIVNEDAATERLPCIIHWQGGSHTSFEMPKPQWGIAEKTAPDTIELIRQMAVRYSDEEIARV